MLRGKQGPPVVRHVGHGPPVRAVTRDADAKPDRHVPPVDRQEIQSFHARLAPEVHLHPLSRTLAAQCAPAGSHVSVDQVGGRLGVLARSHYPAGAVERRHPSRRGTIRPEHTQLPDRRLLEGQPEAGQALPEPVGILRDDEHQPDGGVDQPRVRQRLLPPELGGDDARARQERELERSHAGDLPVDVVDSVRVEPVDQRREFGL